MKISKIFVVTTAIIFTAATTVTTTIILIPIRLVVSISCQSWGVTTKENEVLLRNHKESIVVTIKQEILKTKEFSWINSVDIRITVVR